VLEAWSSVSEHRAKGTCRKLVIICGEKISHIYELSYKNQQAHLAQVVRVHFLKDYVIQVQEV
jgi:hypothetical protein